jgi:hypothetical protein
MRTTFQKLAFATFLSLAFGASTQAADAGKKAPDAQAKSKPGKWETLFDGKSTDKWRGYKKDEFPSSWKVEDGALHTVPGNGSDIVTKDKYDSFELELEWKVTPGANSGVIFHASENAPESWNTGPEMQILDDTRHPDGKNPKTSAGALYALIAPKDKELKPVGEWNKARLIINGNHGEHWLNGKKVVEYELNSKELNDLFANSIFASMPRFAKVPSGHIVLQHHDDEVWFRNVRIRRLSGGGDHHEH